MRCPYCQHLESKVVDSRPTEEGASIRRRRQCMSCGRRFTTYEQVEVVPMTVKKKSGGIEVFDRNKILKGPSKDHGYRYGVRRRPRRSTEKNRQELCRIRRR